MAIVAKISKAGKSITSTEPRDFIFNSAYSTVKIVKQGGSTATVTSESNIDVTITHSLNFIPVCMLFTEPTPGSGNWYMGTFYDTDEDTYVDPNGTYTYADKDYFKFRIKNREDSSKTVSYYYFIFGDTAE